MKLQWQVTDTRSSNGPIQICTSFKEETVEPVTFVQLKHAPYSSFDTCTAPRGRLDW
jgi:hypothetical protein